MILKPPGTRNATQLEHDLRCGNTLCCFTNALRRQYQNILKITDRSTFSLIKKKKTYINMYIGNFFFNETLSVIFDLPYIRAFFDDCVGMLAVFDEPDAPQTR